MSGTVDPILEVRGLACRLGGREVLKNLDLHVEKGKFIGLIGPNGSGKSTLLRALDGLIPIAGGEIRIKGRPLGSFKPRELARNVAFMPQGLGPGISLPVLEVLLFGRYPYRRFLKTESPAEIEGARRMLAYVGLDGFENRVFSELSGGERQLVLFAQILVQDAGLILLDEPTSNLDIGHEEQIFSMAEELTGEGRTVIAAVHNLNQAAGFCGTLILLDRGRIAALGTADEVLRSEILDPIYGVRTRSGPNPATGGFEVNVLPRRRRSLETRIHLIGGAGSAVNLTRRLTRLGFRLSGGVCHRFDSDERLWGSLGVPCVTVNAFSAISAEDAIRAEKLVQEAEVTVLCGFPVGPGNVENLKLAEKARELYIVQESPGGLSRQLFAVQAEPLLEALSRKGRTLNEAELVELLTGRFIG